MSEPEPENKTEIYSKRFATFTGTNYFSNWIWMFMDFGSPEPKTISAEIYCPDSKNFTAIENLKF